MRLLQGLETAQAALSYNLRRVHSHATSTASKSYTRMGHALENSCCHMLVNAACHAKRGVSSLTSMLQVPH